MSHLHAWQALPLVFGLISGNLLGQVPSRTGRMRVAVYPFDQSTIQLSIQKAIGGTANYGQVAADLIVSALSGEADVINRDQMKKLLEEQGRRFDENFDRNQAPEFGKLLGVDAIVTGAITLLDVEEESSNGVGSMIGVFNRKIPKIGNSSKNVTVKVTLAAQLISTATGKTLGAPQATGTSKKSTASQITVNDSSTGGSKSSKAGPDAQIRIALGDAAQAIGNQFPSLLGSPAPEGLLQPPKSATSSTPAQDYVALPGEVGNVGKLEGDVLVFFLAPDTHVQVGEVLSVQHPSFTKNPRTGKSVAIGDAVGTLRVSEVVADQARGKYAGKPVTDQDRIVAKAATGGKP